MISADRAEGWQNQFLRMKRWQIRASTALNDLPNTNFQDALDIALAYFVWCHSMRDWLIKDNAFEKEEIDNLLAGFPVWKIVRDIANRSKHLVITQNPVDADWTISREYDPFAVIIEGKERHHMNLYFDGEKYRLSDITVRSLKMWEDILRPKGVI